MYQAKISSFFLVAWALAAATAALAAPIADLAGGRLYKVDYAADPSITTTGTFDFRINSINSTTLFGAIGYLNVVADLSGDGEIQADEWIVQNIPLNLGEGLLSASLVSAWFDSGNYSVIPESPYKIYATIENEDLPSFWGYMDWYSVEMNAGSFSWGSEDLSGQTGSPLPPTSTATTSGKDSFGPRKGVPDIEQKTNECGPTSAANSLRWLAAQYGFGDKLPSDDDDLIKELMKAMKGSDERPFPALDNNQLYDGKVQYIKQKGLPLVVKGGNTDPNATGGKAFDFIAAELKAGEDVEFLIKWPGKNTGSHWVTVTGYGVNGERLFLYVNDPDDKKTGVAIWELDKLGNFKSPKGTSMWAVSESVPEPGTIFLVGTAMLAAPLFRRRIRRK